MKKRRRKTSEVVHKEHDYNSDIVNLKPQIGNLKNTVAKVSENIPNLEKEIKLLKTSNRVTKTSNVVPDCFNCDECGYSCKREMNFRKHMNTRHHLESEEVDIALRNNSNEKEQKEARLKIKKIEEMVEHLT